MKRFPFFRFLALAILVLIATREVGYPIDTRMAIPGLGELFQSQTVVAAREEIPRIEYLSDFDGLDRWIGDKKADSAGLQGKVVLIQFWSYACVQCVDAIPYMKEWWGTYRRFGLQVVGIHSPSYKSEARLEKVTEAVEDYGISYPVGFDSNFAVWRAYSNRVWPAVYLFDRTGKLAYSHIGSGGYEETEVEIQRLLGVTEQQIAELRDPRPEDPEHLSFGHKKQYWLASPQGVTKEVTTYYTFPDGLMNYEWALEGNWILHEDHAESVSPNAKFRISIDKSALKFAFDHVRRKQSKAFFRLDGVLLDALHRGKDVEIDPETGWPFVYIETVKHFDVYANLVGQHQIEIEFPEPGSQIWSLNFPH